MIVRLENCMGVKQQTVLGSKQHKSHIKCRISYFAHSTLGLMAAGTICHSNLSPGYYPIPILLSAPSKNQ